MGFLSRKRVKRQVTTRTGLKCNRGYNYSYRISSQGRSYVGYLHHPESSVERRQKKENADFIEQLFIEMVRQRFPSSEKAYARRIHDALFKSEPSTPIDMRFPIPNDPSLVLLLIKVMKERDEFARIAKETVELAKEMAAAPRK
jgi:hypothetical protein